MKKYSIALLYMVIVQVFVYTYLFTIDKLYFSPENSSSGYVIPILGLSSIGAIFSLVITKINQLLVRYLFANKTAEHVLEIILLILTTGGLSMYLQVLLGQTLFSLISDIKPLAFLIIGGVSFYANALSFSTTAYHRTPVSVFIFGRDVNLATSCVVKYDSGIVIKDFIGMRECLSEYAANHFIIIDLSEEDTVKVLKSLKNLKMNVTYIYTENMPEFAPKNIKSWKKSHNFSFQRYAEIDSVYMHARSL